MLGNDGGGVVRVRHRGRVGDAYRAGFAGRAGIVGIPSGAASIGASTGRAVASTGAAASGTLRPAWHGGELLGDGSRDRTRLALAQNPGDISCSRTAGGRALSILILFKQQCLAFLPDPQGHGSLRLMYDWPRLAAACLRAAFSLFLRVNSWSLDFFQLRL